MARKPSVPLRSASSISSSAHARRRRGSIRSVGRSVGRDRQRGEVAVRSPPRCRRRSREGPSGIGRRGPIIAGRPEQLLTLVLVGRPGGVEPGCGDDRPGASRGGRRAPRAARAGARASARRRRTARRRSGAPWSSTGWPAHGPRPSGSTDRPVVVLAEQHVAHRPPGRPPGRAGRAQVQVGEADRRRSSSRAHRPAGRLRANGGRPDRPRRLGLPDARPAGRRTGPSPARRTAPALAARLGPDGEEREQPLGEGVVPGERPVAGGRVEQVARRGRRVAGASGRRRPRARRRSVARLVVEALPVERGDDGRVVVGLAGRGAAAAPGSARSPDSTPGVGQAHRRAPARPSGPSRRPPGRGRDRREAAGLGLAVEGQEDAQRRAVRDRDRAARRSDRSRHHPRPRRPRSSPARPGRHRIGAPRRRATPWPRPPGSASSGAPRSSGPRRAACARRRRRPPAGRRGRSARPRGRARRRRGPARTATPSRSRSRSRRARCPRWSRTA